MIAIEKPKNDVEYRLLEIWTSLFGKEEIGTNQDYFELGGDSLLAVRVFKRIEAEFQIRIPMATLFEAPTIELLADFIQGTGSRDARSANAWSSLVAIQPNGSRPPSGSSPTS